METSSGIFLLAALCSMGATIFVVSRKWSLPTLCLYMFQAGCKVTVLLYRYRNIILFKIPFSIAFDTAPALS